MLLVFCSRGQRTAGCRQSAPASPIPYLARTLSRFHNRLSHISSKLSRISISRGKAIVSTNHASWSVPHQPEKLRLPPPRVIAEEVQEQVGAAFEASPRPEIIAARQPGRSVHLSR